MKLLQEIDNNAVFARVELGMSRAEFDELTPEEFAEYVTAWRWREYRTDYRAGLLRYTVAASMGSKDEDGEPLKLKDFLPPRPDEKPKKPRKKRQTVAQAHAIFRASIAHMEILDTRKQNG